MKYLGAQYEASDLYDIDASGGNRDRVNRDDHRGDGHGIRDENYGDGHASEYHDGNNLSGNRDYVNRDGYCDGCNDLNAHDGLNYVNYSY